MSQQPQGGDTRNLIVTVVLSMAVFVVWFWLFPPTDKPKTDAAAPQTQEATVPGAPGATAAPAFQHVPREAALAAEGPRVVIDTPAVDGSIRLNWRLVHVPMEIVDYVIAHELAHLKEMNHGPRFWATVGAILPGYEAARSQLKDFPDDLTLS